MAVHLPANVARRSCGGRAPRAARISARSPANPSETARPDATSEPTAAPSASASNAVAAARSRRNDAPRVLSTCSTVRASAGRATSRAATPSAVSICQAGACSHRNTATAVAGTSRGAIAGSPAGGDNRAHPASPARHSRSSSWGSYGLMRAGSTDRSHAAAGSSNPSSCAMISRRPSTPMRRDAGATCCQAKRNRMKSAGLTGSISARRRLSV